MYSSYVIWTNEWINTSRRGLVAQPNKDNIWMQEWRSDQSKLTAVYIRKSNFRYAATQRPIFLVTISLRLTDIVLLSNLTALFFLPDHGQWEWWITIQWKVTTLRNSRVLVCKFKADRFCRTAQCSFLLQQMRKFRMVFPFVYLFTSPW